MTGRKRGISPKKKQGRGDKGERNAGNNLQWGLVEKKKERGGDIGGKLYIEKTSRPRKGCRQGVVNLGLAVGGTKEIKAREWETRLSVWAPELG